MASLLPLPRTDLLVSGICLGTGEIGSSIQDSDAFLMLDAFVAAGGNFIDTAHNYGNWDPSAPRSASEHAIGRWMKSRGNREKVVLATKGAHWHFDRPAIPRLSRADILEDLEGSLAALQVDHIDLYWLHRDDPATPVATILETLESARQAGKLRFYGASNWRTDRLREAEAIATESGLTGFAADQVLWNAAVVKTYPYGDPNTGFMDETRFIFHEQTGMPAIPFQSQAYGLFSRMQLGTLEAMNPGFRGFYRLPETQPRYERMNRVMADRGLTMTQVTLGWLRGQPFVTVPIVGCRTVAQVTDCCAALDTALTPAEILFITYG